MRREFELTNGDGDAISLNDKKGLLGVDPEGLGISISNNFNASNGNQRLVECEADFEEFKIDIIYGLRDHQQTYQIYLEFVKFLSHPPIVLKYASDAGEKYRNVALKRLTKSERSFGRLLKESLLLEYLTPWYEVKKAEIQQSNQKYIREGKYTDSLFLTCILKMQMKRPELLMFRMIQFIFSTIKIVVRL